MVLDLQGDINLKVKEERTERLSLEKIQII